MKHCMNCGKVNNFFVGDILELASGRILCCNCAEPIRENMLKLYYSKTEAGFDKVANEILETANRQYPVEVVQDVAATIAQRKANRAFSAAAAPSQSSPAQSAAPQVSPPVQSAAPQVSPPVQSAAPQVSPPVQSAAPQQSTMAQQAAQQYPESEGCDMFANIGGKIKGMARAVTWVGIISSFVAGIAMMAEDADMILAALLVMVGGSFVSWASSLTLYGFGQLVENSEHWKNHK